jgi:hypothetical protein
LLKWCCSASAATLMNGLLALALAAVVVSVGF